jgi:ferric-dicitrate binding protein FerR (iron transport regulator)
MKHWDGRDRDDVTPLRLSERDRQRLAQFFEAQAPPRRREPQLGSMIGLVLVLALLAGLSWALSPGDPVSSQLMK